MLIGICYLVVLSLGGNATGEKMKLYENKEAMERLRLMFRTMSNPLRMSIVKFLKKRDGSCFEDIRREFNANNNTVHYHLKKLVATDLVKKNDKYYITDFGRKVATLFEDFDKAMAEFKQVEK